MKNSFRLFSMAAVIFFAIAILIIATVITHGWFLLFAVFMGLGIPGLINWFMYFEER